MYEKKGIKTNEVLVPKEGDNFMFPCVSGSAKLSGKGSEIRTSDPIRQDIEEGEEHRSVLQGHNRFCRATTRR